ncbi:MAG: extracellular solute-binding protein, partial [Candidatus Omnitrophica bacterium]|nr:extracellular solute-binding protein [Candidatus Omnitrophota bacterium]
MNSVEDSRPPYSAIAFVLFVLLVSPIAIGCHPSENSNENGKTILKYWEKWTGTESAAMKEIVGAYNSSQDLYHVQYMEVGGSQIDRKLLLSIAGGNPPDIAGFWNDRIVDYVQNGALLPLDPLMEDSGMKPERYLPRVMDSCRYEGFTWGLPLTPATLALFYNRKLFREAGLDPDSPPRTIAELDAYAERLTKRDETGRIIQLGFSPDIPGWWN